MGDSPAAPLVGYFHAELVLADTALEQVVARFPLPLRSQPLLKAERVAEGAGAAAGAGLQHVAKVLRFQAEATESTAT